MTVTEAAAALVVGLGGIVLASVVYAIVPTGLMGALAMWVLLASLVYVALGPVWYLGGRRVYLWFKSPPDRGGDAA